MTAHVWTFHDKGEHPEAWWRHYRCDSSMVTPNGLKIASVTQGLGILSKDALAPWAANVTCEGAWILARYNTPYRRCSKCKGVTLEDRCPVEECGGSTVKYRLPPTWWQLRADLKSAGLDHDSKRDDAAARGTSVHQMHEDWVTTGKVPNPAAEPKHWQGYARAMARYIMDTDRAGEVSESVEQIVGSATYGFAGKCDEVSVATRKDGKRERRDFKTSKQAYARTHFRQLEAYEGAAVECGEMPTDERAVVVLYQHGEYEVVPNRIATYQQFLNVLQVWRDDQPLKKHEDETYKARAAREKAAKQKAKEAA